MLRITRLWSYCLIAIQTAAGLVQQETEQGNVQAVHTFQALDCRVPVKVQTMLWNDLCDIKNQTTTGTKEKVTITILQYSPERTVKAVCCTKLETRVLMYCGAYSHEKLMEPLTVLSPVVV